MFKIAPVIKHGRRRRHENRRPGLAGQVSHQDIGILGIQLIKRMQQMLHPAPILLPDLRHLGKSYQQLFSSCSHILLF